MSECKKCKVCKQDVDVSMEVKVDDGVVHSGHCLSYFNEQSINENTSNLEETQLLID